MASVSKTTSTNPVILCLERKVLNSGFGSPELPKAAEKLIQMTGNNPTDIAAIEKLRKTAFSYLCTEMQAKLGNYKEDVRYYSPEIRLIYGPKMHSKLSIIQKNLIICRQLFEKIITKASYNEQHLRTFQANIDSIRAQLPNEYSSTKRFFYKFLFWTTDYSDPLERAKLDEKYSYVSATTPRHSPRPYVSHRPPPKISLPQNHPHHMTIRTPRRMVTLYF